MKGRGRRSFLHQSAQTILSEDEIVTKAQRCLVNMAWMIDASCDFILQSAGDCTAETWSTDKRRVEFWELLNDPASLMTTLEVYYIYRACELLKADLTQELLSGLMYEAKRLAVMWDIIDETDEDEMYDRLIVDFEAQQQQIHFDNFDDDIPSYVKTDDCFDVMRRASYLRLTQLHLYFLAYWSDAFIKGKKPAVLSLSNSNIICCLIS